jgi:cation diffusion facilitator family transporter
VSVGAAIVLIAIKLAAGLESGSLALISEALHSATDLVAALLAFTALRVAERPADAEHPYGHDKAEHLSALIEGMILLVASLAIVWEAAQRLRAGADDVTTSPWIYGVLVLVVVIDLARATTSWRAARRLGSAALAGSAVHFASDLAGTLAVIGGLVLVDAGYPAADSIAAIVVAVLVLVASTTLMRRNADILLDRASGADVLAARAALDALPEVEVRRLRLRTAGGRHFADAVVAVPPGAALAQAHAVADAVERTLDAALPGVDAVVHVEPGAGTLPERVRAAAQGVDRVREVHNVRLLEVDGRTEASLHLKLPAATPLADAHATARAVEQAVRAESPGIAAVRTHLEPLEESVAARRPGQAATRKARRSIGAAVSAAAGVEPSEVRFVDTPDGLVAYVSLPLPGTMALSEAHGLAAAARRAGRAADGGVTDVFVQTEAIAPHR